MLQRVKLSPNVPFYWIILEVVSIRSQKQQSLEFSNWWTRKGYGQGLEKNMHQCGYLSSINYFSLKGSLDNREPKETTLISVQDKNTQDISDSKVFIIQQYIQQYYQPEETNLANQRKEPDTTIEATGRLPQISQKPLQSIKPAQKEAGIQRDHNSFLSTF